MTDYETRSRVGMGLEILKLTRQLNEAIEQRDLSLSEHSKTMRQLAECQAREKVLRDALADGISGATNEDIKQAKREALLEAADYLLKRGYQGNGFELSHDLRRMALEDHPMNQTP